MAKFSVQKSGVVLISKFKFQNCRSLRSASSLEVGKSCRFWTTYASGHVTTAILFSDGRFLKNKNLLNV